MKTEHEWTEDDTRFSVFPDKRLPNGAPAHVVAGFAMEPYISSGALIREVLRLAQREADLLTRANEALSVLQVNQPPFAQAVHVLADEAELFHGALARATSELAALNTVKQDKYALEKERDGLALRVANQEREAADQRRLADEQESEVTRLERRVADLEDVIRARGVGTPAPEEIDREAWDALSRTERFEAYREAAGWALLAREWEAKGEEQAALIRRQEEQLSRLKTTEQQAGQREATIERLGRALVEKDHQLALTRETIAHGQEYIQRQRALLDRKERLDAAEARGRQYCAELAEKAEEIRSLNHAFKIADEENDRHIARIAELEASCTGWHVRSDEEKEIADSYRDQNRGLWAAIEDGIAHVERARGKLVRQGVIMTKSEQGAIEDLDLAHEVLSAAVRVDQGGTAPGVEVAHAKPVAQVQPRETAAFRARGDLAAVLTDHADRLKALEALDLAVTRSVVNSLHHAGCRRADEIAALEKRLDLLESWGSEHDDWHRDPCDRSMPVFPLPKRHTGAPGKNSDTPAVRRSSGE